MRRPSPTPSPGSTRPCAKCSARPRRARSVGPTRASLITPETWVRDYIQAQRNHYPELEEAAETLGGALSDPLVGGRAAAAAAQGSVGRRGPGGAAGDARRREPASTIRSAASSMLSSLLRPENRHLRARLPAGAARIRADASPRWSRRPRPPDAGSRRLLHMSFANYAAGAIMMPYGRFLAGGGGISLCDRPAVRRNSAPTSSRSRTG